MKTKIKINLNSQVRFKITKFGKEYIDKVNKEDPFYSRYNLKYEVDEEGYSKEQLWVLMNIFGPGMMNGLKSVIETEIEVIQDF